MPHFLRGGPLLAACLALAAPAAAVEGGLGVYLLGSRDSLAGIAPPPGNYLTTDFIVIDGSAPTLAIGGGARAGGGSKAFVLKVNATHSFAEKLWGGQPVLTFSLPLVSGSLDFASEIENGLSGGFTNNKTGLGDLTITSMLGWSDGKRHWQVGGSVFAPTGYYRKATIDVAARQVDALSLGKNRWAFMPTATFTYLDPDTGLEFSAAASITFSLENTATDYQTAPEGQLEWAALQHLPSGLALGLTGYGYQQFSDDSGAGADAIRNAVGVKSLQARVLGIGPILTYNTRVAGMPFSLKAKYTGEFDARRRFESEIFWVTLGLTF